MNPLLRILILPTLLVMVAAGSARAAPTAWLDRAVIDEGEILRLGIEIEGDVPGDPDTDPLLPLFEIHGIANGHRQIRSQAGFVNFTTWTITLKPRQAGRLQVPSLRIGGQPTPPLWVEVRPATGTGGQGEVFVHATTDRTTAWVQGMVILTLRIHYDIPLADARLILGDIPGALIQRLKGDRLTVETLDGRRYKVIERRFALFPQRAGSLTIPAPVLEARVPSAHSATTLDFDRLDINPLLAGRGEFDSFVTTTRTLRVRGKPLPLEVKRPPDGIAPGPWLPAQRLTLEEHIDQPVTALRVGEPVTRTITLQAHGLLAEQLPPLPIIGDSRDGVYRDKPTRNNTVTADGVVGTLTQRIVHVPRRAGTTLTLPAIEIGWWDVDANAPRQSRLPAHRFEVPAQTTAATADPAAPANTPRPTTPRWPPSRWLWLTAALALLWLLTLLLWLRERGHHRRRRNTMAPLPPAQNPLARKRFHQACRENLPAPARHHLLQWAASHWPDDPPAGLEALAARIDDPAVTELLRRLDAAIWSDGGKEWRGRNLAARLKRLPGTDTGKRQQPEPLPSLYPES